MADSGRGTKQNQAISTGGIEVWLIPSQLSDFVQESAGSTKESPPDAVTSAGDIALWVTLSGTPMQRPCSWPGWKNRRWSRRLFGAVISDSSTARRFVERWTESLRDSRVSRGATQGSSSEPKMNAGSGRLSFGSSLTWNPDSCSWKTSQLSLLAEVSNTCSVTLPKWGSMLSGVVSRRKPLELRTGASACSSWPTAQAYDAENAHAPRLKKDRQTRDPLMVGNYRGDLKDIVQIWTTPQAHDVRKRSAGQTSGLLDNGAGNACLATDAEKWPTPNVPSRGPELSKEHRPESGGIDLQSTVLQWQSPGARDYKGSGNATERPDGKSRLDQLDFAEENFSHPVLPQTGAESLNTSGRQSTGRRLNSNFVEWLMGAPIGWTEV